MKICFPVASNQGAASQVYGHFGSAPAFVVYDTETKTVEAVDNQDSEHEHGQCNPIKALADMQIDAIVVGGIGRRAIDKLNAMGIKVYQSAQETVQANIEHIENHSLSELAIDQACSGHAGGCSH